MLYYKFQNYEEFKSIFGIQYHGNGSKNRKNKILLAYIKNRELLHEAVKTNDFSLLHTNHYSCRLNMCGYSRFHHSDALGTAS